MIQIPLKRGVEQERFHADYLIRLIQSQAINFGNEELIEYIKERYSFMKQREISVPASKSRAEKKFGNECFILKNNPPVYYFLFPDGKLNVEKLAWLLLGIPPENNRFQTIRESIEAIISEIGTGKDKPALNEETLSTIAGYSLRFDRLRVVLPDGKSGEKEDTAYWLQQQLNVRSCPYCNANYTRVSSQGRFRADLEHFFPKSIYPYLSITLYNLFPACQVCNKLKSNHANIVGSHEIDGKWPHKCEIIFPFDESLDVYAKKRVPLRIVVEKGANPLEVFHGETDHFSLQMVPVDEADPLAIKASISCSEIEKRIAKKCGEEKRDNSHSRDRHGSSAETDEENGETVFWKRAISSIRLFGLEYVYQFHKQEVIKLVKNYYRYNREGIIDRVKLISLFSKNDGIEDKKDHTVYEAMVRNMLFFSDTDKEHWGNVPLNKLKADILEQLDALKEPQYPNEK